MLFNLPLTETGTLSNEKTKYQQSVLEKGFLFENIHTIEEELQAVKILCTYVGSIDDFSGPFLFLKEDSSTMSPQLYRETMYEEDHVKYEDEKWNTWHQSIKLAHGVSTLPEEKISYEIVKRALLISAYVKDYDLLEKLLQKKMVLKEKKYASKTTPVFNASLSPFFFQSALKKDTIVTKAIEYIKYGYLEGFIHLLKKVENQYWIEQFLLKAAKHDHIEIVDFLLKNHGNRFQDIIIQQSFRASKSLKISQYLWNNRKNAITKEVSVGVIIDIISVKNIYDIPPQLLEVASFIFRHCPLSNDQLDTIFIEAIDKYSNAIIEVFIKEKPDYFLKRAEGLIPMLARIGAKDTIEFLLKEKTDIEDKVIVKAFLNMAKERLYSYDETFDFLLKERPGSLEVISEKQTKKIFFLLSEKLDGREMNIFLKTGILGTSPGLLKEILEEILEWNNNKIIAILSLLAQIETKEINFFIEHIPTARAASLILDFFKKMIKEYPEPEILTKIFDVFLRKRPDILEEMTPKHIKEILFFIIEKENEKTLSLLLTEKVLQKITEDVKLQTFEAAVKKDNHDLAYFISCKMKITRKNAMILFYNTICSGNFPQKSMFMFFKHEPKDNLSSDFQDFLVHPMYKKVILVLLRHISNKDLEDILESAQRLRHVATINYLSNEKNIRESKPLGYIKQKVENSSKSLYQPYSVKPK